MNYAPRPFLTKISCIPKPIESFEIAVFAGEAIVALFYDYKIILFQPLFEVLNNFAADFFILDYALIKLVGFGFKLRF